jgi:hypothetical protein
MRAKQLCETVVKPQDTVFVDGEKNVIMVLMYDSSTETLVPMLEADYMDETGLDREELTWGTPDYIYNTGVAAYYSDADG